MLSRDHLLTEQAERELLERLRARKAESDAVHISDPSPRQSD
jgi:hypothetical protein